MRGAARVWRGAETWGDSLPRTLGVSAPPIDLFAVARLRQIRRLGLRFIIPRGLLLPVDGGFEVYLRNTVQEDVDLDMSEPDGFLSNRQRFSFAHEIAHTLFYKLSEAVPSPDGTASSNGHELEKTCDRTAGHILMPTSLLRREIKDRENIDAEFVRSVATRFHTSIAVALQRLSAVEPSNTFERCLVLAHRVQGNAQIGASYFGLGLLRTLPRPANFTRVTDWLKDFPRHAIDQRSDCEWQTSTLGRPITITKTELGASGNFLLQVQAGRRVSAAASRV